MQTASGSFWSQTDISFTAPRDDLPRLRAAMDAVLSEVGGVRWSVDDEVAKVSLVGAGMKTRPGVAADMFGALAEEGVNIEMISTSSIRISCVISSADADRAVKAIHAKFGLNTEAEGRTVHTGEVPAIPPPEGP